MAGPRTPPYHRGADLPDLGLTWQQDGETLDFSDPDWSFEVRIGNLWDPAIVSINSVAGAATSPNITIGFADGDLDDLPIGLADGNVIATLDGEQRIMPFEMPIHRTVPPPGP